MPHGHPKKPKHLVTREYIERLIASGKYAAGDRLPSESELVARFRASRPTVARALRELQLLGVIERRAGSGTFVGRAEARRAAAVPDRRRFGLLIPDLGQTEIFEPICARIAQQAQDHGHALVWGDFGGKGAALHAERSIRACRGLIEQQVAGVFFSPVEHNPAGKEINAQILAQLAGEGIPLVLLDRDVVAFPQRSRHDLVGIDNLRGGFELTRHLLGLGHKRVCFFSRPHSAPTATRRMAGFREAMWQAGLEVPATAVCLGDPLDRGSVSRMLTSRRPEAIVCTNDLTAVSLMQTLARLERRVPADVAVVGFDDVKYARLLAVPLTTMRQPCPELGQVAFRTLLERVDHPEMPPRTVLLDPELVVRQSCGAARSTKPR